MTSVQLGPSGATLPSKTIQQLEITFALAQVRQSAPGSAITDSLNHLPNNSINRRVVISCTLQSCIPRSASPFAPSVQFAPSPVRPESPWPRTHPRTQVWLGHRLRHQIDSNSSPISHSLTKVNISSSFTDATLGQSFKIRSLLGST
jgi:hypothetical protein